MKIVVGLSGGIDSTAALIRLFKADHELVGITLRNNREEDEYGKCCSVRDIQDAKRTCAHFGIPHCVVDVVDDFRSKIISYFVAEYERGRTPNPCLYCNPFIKVHHLERVRAELGFDCVATGHYAALDASGRLFRPRDRDKDQSYFLSRLTREQLSHLFFPHASFLKEENVALVREHFPELGDKQESQDICFVPGNDYRAFLKNEKPEGYTSGSFLDEGGSVVGSHKGLPLYTIGQRKGLGIALGRPAYVRKIDPLTNAITIGEPRLASSVKLSKLNWLVEKALLPGDTVRLEYRHRGTSVGAKISSYDDQGHLTMELDKGVSSLAPGQAGVGYKGDQVILSGIIESP